MHARPHDSASAHNAHTNVTRTRTHVGHHTEAWFTPNNSRLTTGIIGIKRLPGLKEISLGYFGKVVRLGMLQREVNAHPNHPVLRLQLDWSNHDLGDVVQGSNTEREESSPHPDHAAGESSSQVPTGSDSEDDLR